MEISRFVPDDLTRLHHNGFDTVIDVRAPAEFAQDHISGAINLPVLSDAERARVGTIYKQDSPFDARKLGAALVARNAAHHLENTLAEKPGGWQPLIYCWRGGQRSGSFATILGQVGWRVAVLDGGYKTWRRMVNTLFYDTALPWQLVLLDGGTGTAKTDILKRCAARGGQVLDLEGAANHRGSVFGGNGPQPSQKLFETRLAAALSRMDPARPVLVEAESNRIGAIRLPPSLWAAMQRADTVELHAHVAERARYIARDYADLLQDAHTRERLLEHLRPYQPAHRIAEWQGLSRSPAELAQALIVHHYDPSYARATRERPARARLDLPDLSAAAREKAADRIATLLETGARET